MHGYISKRHMEQILSHAPAAFFFHSYAYAQSISPAILRFALGRHCRDMYIAPDQFRHWSAAWQPRLEPALQVSPNALNSQSTKGIQR